MPESLLELPRTWDAVVLISGVVKGPAFGEGHGDNGVEASSAWLEATRMGLAPLGGPRGLGRRKNVVAGIHGTQVLLILWGKAMLKARLLTGGIRGRSHVVASTSLLYCCCCTNQLRLLQSE